MFAKLQQTRMSRIKTKNVSNCFTIEWHTIHSKYYEMKMNDWEYTKNVCQFGIQELSYFPASNFGNII